jgi:hypothetical protein
MAGKRAVSGCFPVMTGPTLVVVFERFTDRARRVVVLAQEEARLLNHDYIGTEHILLGIVSEGDGVGARALESLDIPLEVVRAQVAEIVGTGPQAPSGHIPFTARAKTVLEQSLREALQLGHNYIGTEHILLGLIREGEGVGAQVLAKLGADEARVRAEVIRLLSGSAGREAQPAASAPAMGGRSLDRCAFCARDLWELERYVVGTGGVICDACIDAAREAVANAPEAGERAVRLPPRLFGDPPPAPDSVRAIEQALGRVFGGDADEDCSLFLDDWDQLAPVRAEVRRRFPQVTEPSVRLERVRFRGRDEAEVRFTILPTGWGGVTRDGTVSQAAGNWRVSRDTFCQVMALAGVPCPPPELPGQ